MIQSERTIRIKTFKANGVTVEMKIDGDEIVEMKIIYHDHDYELHRATLDSPVMVKEMINSIVKHLEKP